MSPPLELLVMRDKGVVDGDLGAPGTLGNSILLLSLDVLQDRILTPSCFSKNCCLPREKSAQIP
jgi:hypothetical protein